MNKTKKKWCHLPLSFSSPLFGKKGGMRFYFFSSSLFDLLENRLEEGLVSHAWRLFLCCFWIGKENSLKGKNGGEA
uniref:Uncharacterized protein n=1 Tax=Gossypium raimondii TaxID=29730 RepID=A0A0D2RZI1_GOSRA|nr:hypothetical protein B456_012G078900 [Gossypium raimondii]